MSVKLVPDFALLQRAALAPADTGSGAWDATPANRTGSAVTKLTALVGDCENGTCPTVYRTDRGTLAVQGGQITDHGRDVPAHETIVEIPEELIRRLVREHLV